MNTHLKQLWAAMKLPKNFKKSYKFFCLGLDIRVSQGMNCECRPDFQRIIQFITQKQSRQGTTSLPALFLCLQRPVRFCKRYFSSDNLSVKALSFP